MKYLILQGVKLIVRLVNTNSELELKEKMETITPKGEVIKFTGCFILWKKKEFNVWLSYNKGKISSNYIEDDGISKLKEIAQKLNAKVVGDEGEEY